MSKSQGYIKLYRDVLSHWVYDDEILFRAWINLLLTANHSDNKVMFDGELITVHRGEILTSLRKLSEKWKCGFKKTRSIIDILEAEHMITRKSAKKGTQKGTLLTIVNYGVYQDVGHTKACTEESAEARTEESTEETQTINDKIINKNERGMREKGTRSPTLTFGEYQNVFLTDEEYQKLCFYYPNDAEEYIERLSYYMYVNDRTYNNHYAIIVKWIKEDQGEQEQTPAQHYEREPEPQKTHQGAYSIFGGELE